MFRFSIKVGVAAGAVYYLNKEGIWKESGESLKAYDKLNATLEPYVKEISKKIPFELPEVPNSDQNNVTIKLYWNKGVTSTFQFLSDLPGLVSEWTRYGVNAVLENDDVKMIFRSPSGGEAPTSETINK